jgi:hypothetical protein
MLHCPMCDKDVPGLVRHTEYTIGAMICQGCDKLVYDHRHKPYSKVMDKFAIIEAGYQINRKMAKARAFAYSC